MARTKQKTTERLTKDQAQGEMKTFAEAEIKMNDLKAQMEARILKVRQRYEKQIMEVEKLKKDAFKKLKAFGEFEREELFKDKKSLDLVHGVLGFRTGMPKVKMSGIKADEAVKAMKDLKEFRLVTVKESLNKTEIINSRNDNKLMETLAELGIMVVQDEEVFVEYKQEEVPNA